MSVRAVVTAFDSLVQRNLKVTSVCFSPRCPGITVMSFGDTEF